MGSCCTTVDGDNDSNASGGEFLSLEDKKKIFDTWQLVYSEQNAWESLVRSAVDQETCGVRRLVIGAGNQLMFGAIESRLKREAEEMSVFLNGLIVNLELVEQDITLACEHFGSEDAEAEIRDGSLPCKIKEASTFLTLLVSHLHTKHNCDPTVSQAWRKLATMIIHSMKDGAYWAEERWGVHLMSHTY